MLCPACLPPELSSSTRADGNYCDNCQRCFGINEQLLTSPWLFPNILVDSGVRRDSVALVLPFFGLEMPSLLSSAPGESQRRISRCILSALLLLTSVPLASQRDLPEWVEDTEPQQKLPFGSPWAEVRLGQLLCWSAYGFSLIYTQEVYGISRIPMGCSLFGSVGSTALPPLSPPAFLMLYCLYTASSAFLNPALALYSSYKFLQSFTSHTLMCLIPVTSAPGVDEPGLLLVS